MFKSNLLAGLIGIALMCAFLGIMIAWVKALPLIIIWVGVMLMMIYDFIKTMREIHRNSSN
ncbi:hypothetical protein [Ferrovibrio sp.]|uniref:hypothetical protein n=1 Tax=Ferrovibrio sp. TaxID=1917215 RepID=UPI00260241A0|nr:hypothetical protein [Ferrovibrio sp.]